MLAFRIVAVWVSPSDSVVGGLVESEMVVKVVIALVEGPIVVG